MRGQIRKIKVLLSRGRLQEPSERLQELSKRLQESRKDASRTPKSCFHTLIFSWYHSLILSYVDRKSETPPICMILEENTGGIKIKHPGMPWAGKVIMSGSEAPVRFALAGVCPDGGR